MSDNDLQKNWEQIQMEAAVSRAKLEDKVENKLEKELADRLKYIIIGSVVGLLVLGYLSYSLWHDYQRKTCLKNCELRSLLRGPIKQENCQQQCAKYVK